MDPKPPHEDRRTMQTPEAGDLEAAHEHERLLRTSSGPADQQRNYSSISQTPHDVEAAQASEGLLPAQPNTPHATQPLPPNPDAVALTLCLERKRIATSTTIRTLQIISFSALFLQTAALQTVSTHLRANMFDLPNVYPGTFTFINLFVAHTRLLAVPLLFFCAGTRAGMALGEEEGDKGMPIGRALGQFLIKRAWKTGLMVVIYQGAAWWVRRVWPLPPSDSDWGATPYYDTREGIEALMNGPTAYVLAILLLDYVYALLRLLILCIRCAIFRNSDPSGFRLDFSAPKARNTSMILIFVPLISSFWVYAVVSGSITPFPVDSFQARLLYAVGAAEVHVPVLFIVAYISGISMLPHYVRQPSAASNDADTQPAAKPALTLLQHLTLTFFVSSTIIWGLYRDLPDIRSFLDVRRRPVLVSPGIEDPTTAATYASWVFMALIMIPPALVRVAQGELITSVDMFMTSADMSCWDRASARVAHAACLTVHLQFLLIPAISSALVWQNAHPLALWIVFGLSGPCAVCVGSVLVTGWRNVREAGPSLQTRGYG